MYVTLNEAQSICEGLNSTLPWTRFSLNNPGEILRLARKLFWLSTDPGFLFSKKCFIETLLKVNMKNDSGVPPEYQNQIAEEFEKESSLPVMLEMSSNCVYLSRIVYTPQSSINNQVCQGRL